MIGLLLGTIPLIAGANFMQKFKNDSDLDLGERLVNANIAGVASVADPIVELSFLQGISNLFSAASYNQEGMDKIMAVASTAGFDYLSQFFMTAGGKMSKVLDPTVRDTSTTKTGVVGQWERTKKQIINKTWSSALPAKTDKWGRALSRDDTPVAQGIANLLGGGEAAKGVGRAIDQMLPTNVTSVKDLDKTERKLLELQQDTGEKILPTQKSVDKTITIDKEDHRLTDEEYVKAKGIFGRESKKMLDALMSANGYDKLTKEEGGEDYLADIASKIYLYSKQVIKEDYCKEHDLEFTPTKNEAKEMYNSITAIEKAGGTAKDYFDYLIGTRQMKTKEKLQFLNNMNVNQGVKNAIYGGDTSQYRFMSESEDENYDTLQILNGGKDKKGYLEYKQKKLEGYFTNKNDDPNGKDVENQKRTRLKKTLNNSDLSDIEKLYIFAKEGYAVSKDGGGMNANERMKLYKALEGKKDNIGDESFESMLKDLGEAEEKAKNWKQEYNKEILNKYKELFNK